MIEEQAKNKNDKLAKQYYKQLEEALKSNDLKLANDICKKIEKKTKPLFTIK